jgi:hypothetical protein
MPLKSVERVEPALRSALRVEQRPRSLRQLAVAVEVEAVEVEAGDRLPSLEAQAAIVLQAVLA